jgi:uncharacterized protein YbcC (UPF0753/DUF2309 family)
MLSQDLHGRAHSKSGSDKGDVHSSRTPVPFPDYVRAACESIAPTWPLDQFIAVNPWWEEVGQSIEHVAAQAKVLSGASLLMPKEFYLGALKDGRISGESLRAASIEQQQPFTLEDMILRLERVENPVESVKLLPERYDSENTLNQAVSLKSNVVHQISQYCAAYFDTHHAAWHQDRSNGFYGGWRIGLIGDRGIGFLVGRTDLKMRAQALPAHADELIVYAFKILEVPEDLRQAYAFALLGSIHGWASWCAFQRWQAYVKPNVDHHIYELFAIRLAWELLLDDNIRGPNSVHAKLLEDLRNASSNINKVIEQNKALWICQRALELTYQNELIRDVRTSFQIPQKKAPPAVQAYFCIDVRAEVFRRAFEEQSESVQTGGFAGSFGMPIDFTPFGTKATRPHLPGLLSPQMSVVESCENPHLNKSLAKRRQARLSAKAHWGSFQALPSSAFSFVESFGIFSLFKLVRNCFPNYSEAPRTSHEGLFTKETKMLRRQLVTKTENTEETIRTRVELCAKILRTMFRTRDFARIVLFVGHESQSANNAHASGFHCGACCGQPGEVNARILAQLLNDNAVRLGLEALGILIPPTTYFLSGLHNTTTDDVTLFETEDVPPTHLADLAELRVQLDRAAHQCRLERAPKLDICTQGKDVTQLHKIFKARANNWAEVRPEWGLVDNAAFMIAPRSRTKGLNLKGRAFLHDYIAHEDANHSVLELLMTGTMVVAHWINMQYFASVVDNRRYGSGNKTLHNVVGGNIGVFEGNGGDLRIGLSQQSLWHTEKLMHTPQRLSVFIEASQEAIGLVISKHTVVQNLVNNGWIFLFQINPDNQGISRYENGVWRSSL